MRLAALFLLFLAGLLGTSWAIRALRPEPESHGRRLKYEHLRDRGADYTMVLVGSSRVNHSLVPRVVEERLAAAGLDHRVYNYGIGGMRSFEADEVLDKVLALDLPKLEVVVVEWPDWDGVLFGDDDKATERAVGWHTPRRTVAALESLRRRGGPWPVQRRNAVEHLRLAGSRLVNYGAGSSWLQRELGVDEFEDLPEVVERDGFAATGEMEARTPEQEARRIQKTRAVLERKHVLDLGNRMEVEPATYNRAALDRQARAAAERGVRIVWAVMPGESYHPHAWRLGAEEPELPLLLFNSPERYPALYTFENRWDPDHLNEEGALLFSAIFGDALAETLVP